nr:von Willebrand factor A domain-containing protein 1-like [Pocillopora verrucosa]
MEKPVGGSLQIFKATRNKLFAEIDQFLIMETLWVCLILTLALSSDLSQAEGDCHDQILDIAILADVSRSMNFRQRRAKIKLIDDLVEKKGVSPSGNHFALITFAKDVVIESDFNNKSNYEEDKLKHFVQKTVYVKPKAWGTRTDLAMDLAAKELFTEQRGDRPGAKNIIILFTDGKPFKSRRDKRRVIPFKDSIKVLESKGVSIIVVGVGRNVFRAKRNMYEMAGERGKVLLYPSFDDLPGHLDDIVKATCEEMPVPHPEGS